MEVTLEVEISEETILAGTSSQTHERTNVTHSLLLMSKLKLAVCKDCHGFFLLRRFIYFLSMTCCITMRILFSSILIRHSVFSTVNYLGKGEAFSSCLSSLREILQHIFVFTHIFLTGFTSFKHGLLKKTLKQLLTPYQTLHFLCRS